MGYQEPKQMTTEFFMAVIGLQTSVYLVEYWAEMLLAGILIVILVQFLRTSWMKTVGDDIDLGIDDQAYKRLVETASDIIYEVDEDGRFSYVNPMAVEITGYSQDELIGMRFLYLIRPDYRNRIQQFYISQVESEEQNTYREFPILTKEGQQRWIGQWVTVAPKGGEKLYIQAIARDITPQRETQKKLEQQNHQLKLLTENMQDLICLHKPDGTYEWVSQSSERLLGYRADELVGQEPYEWIHPDDQKQAKEQFQEAVLDSNDEEYVNSATYRMRHRDGHYIWMESLIKPLFNDNEEIEQIQTSSRDITERVQFETALEDSELKLRLFIKHTPAAMAMFDREMRYIMVSDRWLSDYGLEGEDIIGESHYDVFPDLQDRWKQMHRRCLMGNVESSDEDTFINRNGEREWIRWEVHPWHKSTGEIGGLIIFTELITDRKKSEEQLLRNQELFSVVAEARKELVSNADYDQSIQKTLQVVGESVGIDRITVFTNRSDEEPLFRYEYRWALGNMVESQQVVKQHHEVGEVVRFERFGESQWLDKLQNDEVVQQLTSEMSDYLSDRYTKVGIRSIILFPVFMKNRLWGIIRLDDFLSERVWTDNEEAIIRAISTSLASQHERKLAEQAVLEEQEQLRSVIENAPIPIMLLDDNLQIVTYSSQWIDQFPTDEYELNGEHYWDRYPDWKSYWKPIFEQGLQGKVLSENEDEIPHDAGVSGYFRWAVHPWQGSGDEIEGIILVVDRIDELVKARLEAESASRAKSAFLANMSHELRTPLNAILGYAQILKQDPNISEAMQPYVDTIYNSGDHLLAMINDILDISKIEAGKMEVSLSEFNINDLFTDIEWMFALRAEQKGLHFDVSLDDETPELLVSDSSKWRQIIINLVSNAIKFTSEGRVTLEGSWCPEHEIDGSLEGADALLELKISDTGIGIPDEQQEDIFEPFQQVTGRYNEGTGLGLSITKHLVQQLGGDISLWSSQGEGTIFTIHLPVQVSDSIPDKEIDSNKQDGRQRELTNSTAHNSQDVSSERKLTPNDVAQIIMKSINDTELTVIQENLRLQDLEALKQLTEQFETSDQKLGKALIELEKAADAFDFYFITQVHKALSD